MIHTFIPSPVGQLLLTGDGHALTGLYPTGHRRAPNDLGRRDASAFAEASDQLAEYFAGVRIDFDLPLAPSGTPFQQRVWRSLLQIDFGATRSYQHLAAELGLANGARAVGSANSRNPISIIVPCHRLIGSSGALTGYASGVPMKRWLLRHEQRLPIEPALPVSTGLASREPAPG